MMAQLSEILLAQPHQCGPVEFRIAPDEVMSAGHKFAALYIPPGLDIVVSSFANHSTRIPVLLFSRDKVSALKQKDLLAGRRHAIRKRSAPGTGPDNDDVVVVVCVHCGTSIARCHEPGGLFRRSRNWSYQWRATNGRYHGMRLMTYRKIRMRNSCRLNARDGN